MAQTRTSAEWVQVLNDAGVPTGPIYSIDQMFADPQVQQLNQVKPVPHKGKSKDMNVIGQAMSMSRNSYSIRLAAPDGGEHTAEILSALGMDEGRINDLKQRHVV